MITKVMILLLLLISLLIILIITKIKTITIKNDDGNRDNNDTNDNIINNNNSDPNNTDDNNDDHRPADSNAIPGIQTAKQKCPRIGLSQPHIRPCGYLRSQPLPSILSGYRDLSYQNSAQYQPPFIRRGPVLVIYNF